MPKRTDLDDVNFAQDPELEAPAERPPAAQMLRNVEDEWFGEDATRIDGKIVDGHGSAFSKLHPDKKAHHAALLRLHGAEQKVAGAKSALVTAEGELAKAEQDAESTFRAAADAD